MQQAFSAVRPTFFLDLDQCSLYGEDCNDLISLAQSTGMPSSSIKALMLTLINPAMLQAMRTLLARHPNARVCIYTRKSGFITKNAVPRSMLKAGEAYIKSHITVDDIFESEDPSIHSTMINPYKRLFLARKIIQELLGLESPPELIITSVTKSVKRACLSLLDPPADPCHAFLWDDNVEIAGGFHVITVPKYNAVTPSAASLVEQQLDAMFEGRKLDGERHAKIISFLCSALPEYSCMDRLTNDIFVHVTSEKQEEEVVVVQVWNMPPLDDDDVISSNSNSSSTSTSTSGEEEEEVVVVSAAMMMMSSSLLTTSSLCC